MPEVLGNDVSFESVPTRYGGLQASVLVSERDGHAINFGLHDIRQIGEIEKFSQPLIEVEKFFFVVSVVEAQHGKKMSMRGKCLESIISDLRETLLLGIP